VTAALELRSVSASYGPFRALFDVSFAIEQGEALALVGSNGAGKTTVARVVSGLVKPDDGQVLVGGEDFTGKRAYEFARASLAHAPEGRSVFATLSVEENLTLSFRRVHGRKGVKQSLARAYEMFPVLGRRKGQTAGTLSGGEQRMLSLARVLVELPKIMVADELSLGLAPIIVDELYESLGRLRREGTSLLIVEQQVGHALRLCDRVAVLDHGTITWTGAAAEATQVVTSAFDHSEVIEESTSAPTGTTRRRTTPIKPAQP
jgi:branched-chain amino acid transport system ATP-binding protein